MKLNIFTKPATLAIILSLLTTTVLAAGSMTYKNKHIAGSKKNPVYQTVVPIWKTQVHHGLHRGRVIMTTMNRKGGKLFVNTEFRNHNKRRGWHLTNEVVALDKNGKALGRALFEKYGIKRKSMGKGYRVLKAKTQSISLKNAAYIRVTSFRQSEKDFLKETLKFGVKVYEVLSTASGGAIGGVINHTINRAIKGVIGGGSGGGYKHRQDHGHYIQP